MAKVYEPSQTLETFRTIGKSFCFSHRKNYNYIRGLVKPLFISQSSKNLIVGEWESILEQWQGLTPEEREEWNTLALEVFLLGVELYFQEGYKSGLQSIYNVGTYDQNVFMELE